MPELRLTRRYIGVFGASGTGKTQGARAIVTGRVLGPDAPERWPRRLVYDPAEDYVEGIDVEKVARSRREVLDYLNPIESGEEFSVAYRPPIGDTAKEGDDDAEAAEAAEMAWLSRVAYAVESCVLLVDEGAEACGRYCRPATIRLAKRGRHRAVSVILASQRPVDVRPSLRGEAYADEVYLFRLGRREDLMDVAAHTSRELAQLVANLAPLHCIRLRAAHPPSQYVVLLADSPAGLPWLIPVTAAPGAPLAGLPEKDS